MSSSTLISGTSQQSPRTEGGSPPDLVVATTRARQTASAPSPFRDVLAGGVGILLRGAEVATSVVAGPVMAAAVRGVGVGAANAIGGSSGTRPLTPGAAGGVGTGSGLPASLAGPGSDQSDLARMHSMQRESQAFNLQLLELQEDVQQENRRFTTVSNVLRAKHDTAKAAVANVRS